MNIHFIQHFRSILHLPTTRISCIAVVYAGKILTNKNE